MDDHHESGATYFMAWQVGVSNNQDSGICGQMMAICGNFDENRVLFYIILIMRFPSVGAQ